VRRRAASELFYNFFAFVQSCFLFLGKRLYLACHSKETSSLSTANSSEFQPNTGFLYPLGGGMWGNIDFYKKRVEYLMTTK